MKLTRRQLKRLISEAVKQYAVDPDQFFSVSPNDPQYAKLKDLAKVDIETAKMLGYNPEIKGDEIIFSTNPIAKWFLKTYSEYEDSSKEETSHEDKLKHAITSFQRFMYDALDPDRKANFGGGPTERAQKSDPELKHFWRWQNVLWNPIERMAKRNINNGGSMNDFFSELSIILSNTKKRFPSTFAKVANILDTDSLNRQKVSLSF